MGFSGSGSSVTRPHTHSSAIVNDGGSLDMDNVTQASLSAGDIVYSDGAALQRLAIGGAGQSLTSSGAAPQWSAAAGISTNTRIDFITANFSTSSTTYVSTGLQITITNAAGGIAIIQTSGAVVAGATNVDNNYAIYDDGVAASNAATGICNNQSAAAERQTISVNWSMETDGSQVTLMTKVNSSNCTIIGTNPPSASMIISEVY
jgi:hypothetical protein